MECNNFEDNVKNVAQKLISGTLDIATSMITRDIDRVFVYKNPLNDDSRPERRGSELQESPSKGASDTSIKETPPMEQDEDTNCTPLQLESDSNRTMQSQRTSFLLNERDHRTSLSSEDTPKRSTFGDIVFREKPKQCEQESMWNYKMSATSSASESELENVGDVTSLEIQEIKQILHEWPKIGNFNLQDALQTIERFVGSWKLALNTKFALLKDIQHTKSCLGEQHHVTVAFSRPTKTCPNPLAVAHVYFAINVSYVMPSHFPVYVTYRFETYNVNYMVMGRRNMRSITFQNRFIENILNAKLSFYVQLFEKRFGPLNQQPKVFTEDEEYQMFRKQYDMYVAARRSSSKPTTIHKRADETGSRDKSQGKFLIATSSTYQLMIGEIEPWKIAKIDPVAVQNTYETITQSYNIIDNQKRSPSDTMLHKKLSVFGFLTPKNSAVEADLYLHDALSGDA